MPVRTGMYQCTVQLIKCCPWWWTNDSPKHVEPFNEKIKTIHNNFCIPLVYIHIAIRCTVHTTSKSTCTLRKGGVRIDKHSWTLCGEVTLYCQYYTALVRIKFPTSSYMAISPSHTDGNAIFHLSSQSEQNLTSLLSKSVALCYRKYGDSNLIIYTHRTSWMISSYSTPPPFPAATLKVPSCSFVARLSFYPSKPSLSSSHPPYM